MRLCNFLLATVFLVLFAGGVTTPAAAQKGEILITGQVLEEESGAPIVGVLVELRQASGRRMGRRITDENGEFQFSVGRGGGYRLFTSRMGYRETLTPILWTDGHEYFRLEIRLDTEAVLLAPLEVVARARARPSAVFDGFRHRQRTGSGYYFTRADIEQIRPALVTDLLARVPGVRLTSSGVGVTRRTVEMGRSQGIYADRNCPVQLFIDGLLLNRQLASGTDPGFTIDDAVSPLSVEGIEVYRGLSSVPAEFFTPLSHCGVIAIWTRRGR